MPNVSVDFRLYVTEVHVYLVIKHHLSHLNPLHIIFTLRPEIIKFKI